MKKIIVAIPHSHTWFWTQTCLMSLIKNRPLVDSHEVTIVIVDNSPWSPTIKGITGFDHYSGNNMFAVAFSRCIPSVKLEVIKNNKSNKFHASALDCVVEKYNFDLLMALETDVLVLRPDWLQWFIDQLRPTDYAVGMWHHEQFVNPSCTLYRGDALRDMARWCIDGAPQDELRWGPDFSTSSPLDPNLNLQLTGNSQLTEMKSWIAGPFAEKRGFPQGTTLKEKPSGQEKGPGWYEPGQQLHHWAVEQGYTYTVCPTMTTMVNDLPVQTLYGSTMPDPQRQLSATEMFGNAYTAHMWGGTRALDILKHPVTCQFVLKNTPGWLAREARFWREVVPQDVQEQTLDLIRRYGWHLTGQGNAILGGDARDREAAEYVRACYGEGGVVW